MNDEILIRLLECCKNELQITWDDANTDERILTHIKNGVTLIGRITAVDENEYLTGGRANALLLAYVRRAHCGDASTFTADYLSDIIALQNDSEVDAYESASQAEGL